MAPHDLLFLHPLIGRDDTWSGYLVEFADDSQCEEQLSALIAHPLRPAFGGHHPWFIPASPDTPTAAAPLVTLFASAALTGPDTRYTELEASLRKKQRKLALSLPRGGKLPASGIWDYVLIEASEARCLAPFGMQSLAARTHVVSTNVRSHTDQLWLSTHGGHLSTGEYLLTRHSSDGKSDLTRLKLLELLALVAADSDTPALDAIFRQELKLSYSLLRLVNSAAMAPRTPITSFAHAINLLGRRQLQRWLQLLVFADPNSNQQVNPLLLKAATRGHLMEVLSRPTDTSATTDHDDCAFMVGAFSLLPVLLNLPMKDILHHLPVADIVSDALLNQTGELGELLAVLDAADTRELARANVLAQKLGIAPARFLDAQLEALHWASRIHVPH